MAYTIRKGGRAENPAWRKFMTSDEKKRVRAIEIAKAPTADDRLEKQAIKARAYMRMKRWATK